MKRLLSLLTCVAVMTFASCVKNPGTEEKKPNDLTGFDWKTTKTVPVNIVSDNGGIVPLYIYDGSQLVAAGYTPLNDDITVPASCESLTVSTAPLAAQGKSTDGTQTFTLDANSSSRSISVDDRNFDYLQNEAHIFMHQNWANASYHNVAGWEQFIETNEDYFEYRLIEFDDDDFPTQNADGSWHIPHECQWVNCPDNQDTPPTMDYTTAGTYLFEDLFPSMGDFDMNDFVVEEYVKPTIVSDKKDGEAVAAIELLYKINAMGSSGRIALAIDLPGAKGDANIKDEVELYLVNSDGTETPYACLNSSNLFKIKQNRGTENLQADRAVIPLFDNFGELIPASAKGLYFNTVPEGNGGKGEPICIKVKINFKKNLKISEITTNPFIMPLIGDKTVAEQRGREIHLRDMPYTQHMNTDLFSQGSASGTDNFRTKEGFVWGIYIPVTGFRHATERTDLRIAYPEVAKWMQSRGAGNAEWYKHPDEAKVWNW